jgi:diguanylate cyclase (GGDEF)-like protein
VTVANDLRFWSIVDGIPVMDEVSRHLFCDDLTGLPTSLLLTDRIAQLLKRAQHNGAPFALLVCDLSNFRFINHTHGWLTGDQMLIEFARRIDAITRLTDTIARIGGDEFGILLTNCASTAVALRTAQRLQDLLQQPFIIDGESCAVLVDIGITLSSGVHTAEELLQRTWEAMYQAKQGKSKDRLGIYDGSLTEEAMGRLAMGDELRNALVRGELVVHYQPIVEITTGRVCAVEALLRWPHPVHGLITPDRFIAIAEESGLIAEIGAWVLWQACMAATGWNGVAVHVNVAAYQLAQANLVDDIEAALNTTGLNPAMLVVEITESAVVRDVGHGRIQKLNVLGIQIGIDDFGMGYSSLARLRRVPAHILKIDKQFVENLVTSEKDRAILRAIHDLATAMGMQVVAEGVETADQLVMLAEIGFTRAQGYYWSFAVPADEVPAMVARLLVRQLLTHQVAESD